MDESTSGRIVFEGITWIHLIEYNGFYSDFSSCFNMVLLCWFKLNVSHHHNRNSSLIQAHVSQTKLTFKLMKLCRGHKGLNTPVFRHPSCVWSR